MKKWIALAALLVFPAGAAGQIGWDSPLLLPPNAPDAVGVYLVDVAGGDLGVLGMWRSPVWDFGLRGGIAEGRGYTSTRRLGPLAVHGEPMVGGLVEPGFSIGRPRESQTQAQDHAQENDQSESGSVRHAGDLP